MTRACVRCGIRREVNESRETPEFCFDCTLVERDLAAMHGTNAGYYRHYKAGELACESCLAAHREAKNAYNITVGKHRARRPAPSGCGHPNGYRAHNRRGERPCDACREAWNAYKRERWHARRKDDAA